MTVPLRRVHNGAPSPWSMKGRELDAGLQLVGTIFLVLLRSAHAPAVELVRGMCA